PASGTGLVEEIGDCRAYGARRNPLTSYPGVADGVSVVKPDGWHPGFVIGIRGRDLHNLAQPGRNSASKRDRHQRSRAVVYVTHFTFGRAHVRHRTGTSVLAAAINRRLEGGEEGSDGQHPPPPSSQRDGRCRNRTGAGARFGRRLDGAQFSFGPWNRSRL